MRKVRLGRRAKFVNKNKCFVHVLFLVCKTLRHIFTSSTLQAGLLLEISIHLVDVCILAMSCVGYVHSTKDPFKPP